MLTYAIALVLIKSPESMKNDRIFNLFFAIIADTAIFITIVVSLYNLVKGYLDALCS